MRSRIREISDAIAQLEAELAAAIAELRTELSAASEDALPLLPPAAVDASPPRSLLSYFAGASVGTVVGALLSYAVAPPLMLLDGSLNLYQAICFRIYRIPRVRRRDHLRFDRYRLPYLNDIEAVHCSYCSYAAGVLSFAREIASRSEQYWCPIKHRGPMIDPHRRHETFLDFGDAAGYRTRLGYYRDRLRDTDG